MKGNIGVPWNERPPGIQTPSDWHSYNSPPRVKREGVMTPGAQGSPVHGTHILRSASASSIRCSPRGPLVVHVSHSATEFPGQDTLSSASDYSSGGRKRNAETLNYEPGPFRKGPASARSYTSTTHHPLIPHEAALKLHESFESILNDYSRAFIQIDIQPLSPNQMDMKVTTPCDLTNFETSFKKAITDLALNRDEQKACLNELLLKLDEQEKKTIKSLYPLRRALFMASISLGIPIPSWMISTKGPRPTEDCEVWGFLDNDRNWYQEALVQRDKAVTELIRRADVLAKFDPHRNELILLKGECGSGKSLLAKDLELAKGSIKPDDGKDLLRQFDSRIPHSAVHIEGSQIAHLALKDRLKKQGIVVYDSLMSNPHDIPMHIAQSGPKNVTIHDVTRCDLARILALLRRGVNGNDPRIHPGDIIDSAVKSRSSRTECMNTTLRLQPIVDRLITYHLYLGNEQGGDRERIVTLTPGHKISFNRELSPEEIIKRLGNAGLVHQTPMGTFEYEASAGDFLSTKTPQGYKDELVKALSQTVKMATMKLSTDERAKCERAFNHRILISPFISIPTMHKGLNLMVACNSLVALYRALDSQVKEAIPEQAFLNAFKAFSEEMISNFLTDIETKLEKDLPFSYMDLPLGAALSIHHLLQRDPWTTNL